jgi:adenylate kinase
MENEIAVLKLQLANTRDALYFAKRDHEREIAELQVQRANDEAHIVECHKTISKLLGDK